MTRAVRGIACLGLLLAALPLAAAAGEADRLYEAFLVAETDDARAARLEALVAAGDAGAEAILAGYRARPVPEDRVRPLTSALVRIGTPRAMSVLKTFMGVSAVGAGEVPDPKALLQAITRQYATPPGERVWTLLPEATRAVVREKGTGPEPLTDAERIRLVAGLNAVIREHDFATPELFQGVRIRPEARELLGEHVPGPVQYGVGVPPLLVRRMNRLLLEDLYAGLILPGPEIDAERYRQSHAAAGLAALARSPDPSARAMLLTYQPLGPTDQIGHIRALDALESSEAARMLGDYLVSPHARVSAAAAPALGTLARERPDAAVDALRAAIRAYEGRAASADLAHVPRALLELGLRVLPENDLAGLLAGFLESRNEATRAQAVTVLARRPTLLRNDAILRAAVEAIRNGIPAKTAEHLAGVLRSGRLRSSLPVAAALLLESESHDVRMKTCDALAAITGETAIGRNPAKWEAWLRQHLR
jgi:hypothetical protein